MVLQIHVHVHLVPNLYPVLLKGVYPRMHAFQYIVTAKSNQLDALIPAVTVGKQWSP